MADGKDKVAAALLACEASRQTLANIPQSNNISGHAGTGGRNISGELLKMYQYFLSQISDGQPPTVEVKVNR